MFNHKVSSIVIHCNIEGYSECIMRMIRLTAVTADVKLLCIDFKHDEVTLKYNGYPNNGEEIASTVATLIKVYSLDVKSRPLNLGSIDIVKEPSYIFDIRLPINSWKKLILRYIYGNNHTYSNMFEELLSGSKFNDETKIHIVHMLKLIRDVIDSDGKYIINIKEVIDIDKLAIANLSTVK